MLAGFDIQKYLDVFVYSRNKIHKDCTMFLMSVILVAITGHVAHALDFKVVDLTHTHGPTTIFWPGNPPYNFTILYRNLTSGGFWAEVNAFQTAEHGGTHLDAPAHFGKGKYKAHEIPMEKLVGPGVIINVKAKAAENPDYRVSMDDVRAWESKHGKIPEGAVVFMNSGWSSKYPNKTLTFGSENHDNTGTFHFPGWHEDTVDWLIKKRFVHVVGVDTPSIDYARSTTYPVHQIVSETNTPGVENVANLHLIPESGSIIYVAAIKLYDGSGGPARVFATVSRDVMTGGCSSPLLKSILLYILVAATVAL